MPLAASTRINFYGVAAYEIVTRDGRHILIDPFLDENPGSPVKHDGLERVDLVIVSHAAFDHLGDTAPIAKHYNAPVICGGEVKAWLMANGIPATQIRATTWGIRVEVAGIEVQPVECHHWSQIRMPDGTFASGVPMAFVIYADEGVRFYHYGDTAIFSDMKLQAELYRPTIGAIGIANPQEILHRNPMPGRMMTGEMSPYEGALAAQWLGLETVLPCHYITPEDPDVREFQRHLAEAAGRGERVPRSVVLKPGTRSRFLREEGRPGSPPELEMDAPVLRATDRTSPLPAAEVAPAVARIMQMLAERGEDPRPTWQIGALKARERTRRIWADYWSAVGPRPAREHDAVATTRLGPIRVRIYDPDSDGTRPIVYFHGGGFVVGDLDTHAGVIRRLALYSGRPVISVDYRLAPENPYPAPLDDCVAAAEAVANGTAGLTIAGDRFALAGDSAGANLALATLLRLRDERLPQAACAALIYGCYDPAMSLPSFDIYGGGAYLLASADIKWFWQQYLGAAFSDPPVYAAPLAADLSGLPPLFVPVGECDPLRDDSIVLSERLRAASVEHEFRLWPGMIHGSAGMARDLNQADHYLAEMAVWLARRLS